MSGEVVGTTESPSAPLPPVVGYISGHTGGHASSGPGVCISLKLFIKVYAASIHGFDSALILGAGSGSITIKMWTSTFSNIF